MSKPDPYGDWVLFPPKEGEPRGSAVPDAELVTAAREAWPRVLIQAKKESVTGGLGSETESLAKQVWEQVLRSVAKTRSPIIGGREERAFAYFEIARNHAGS